MGTFAQCASRICAHAALAAAACLAVLAGCSSTSMDQVWHDSSRAAAPLGKTLVIAVAPRAATTAALEDEWVRELQARGHRCPCFARYAARRAAGRQAARSRSGESKCHQ